MGSYDSGLHPLFHFGLKYLLTHDIDIGHGVGDGVGEDVGEEMAGGGGGVQA